MTRAIALMSAALLAASGSVRAESPTSRPAEARPTGAKPADPKIRSTFEAVPLDAFLDTLRDAGLNLAINWPAIEAVGIDRSTPITLRLRNATARTLLNLALKQAGNGQLAWYVGDGIVHVTTRELSDRALITRVYPVGDLLVTVPDFVVPSVSVGGGGKSSSSLISGSASRGESDESMAARGERLCDLVRTLVRPDVWIENGGVASVRYFGGNLIVTAPRDVQNLIGR